ncbi:MAG: hypothetical protein DRJ50_11855 [Actinobacteria bacterium]|nr:MAG: hypothetical protein DRJ50_11855 [Actinomycetota bacterium]
MRDQSRKTTKRVSVDSSGAQSNGHCWGPAISQSGQYIAFYAAASNLVSGDTNGVRDVFVHNRYNGRMELVSIDKDGGSANGQSVDPAISADGRIVAFESNATDLVPGDTNGKTDVFIRNLNTDVTTRISVRSDGRQANGNSNDPEVSGDGRFVVFDSAATNLIWKDTNGRRDVFIHEVATGKTKRMSVSSSEKQAKGASRQATVNWDGRYIAFESKARNLVAGDTSRGNDVFLRDRKLGKTKRVSVSNTERQAKGWSGDPKISNSGRYIAFESTAPNLVAKDTNGKWDVFVRDHIRKTTRIVSRTASGGQAKYGDSDDPAISGDARYISFESTAKNIVSNDKNRAEDIFRRGALR